DGQDPDDLARSGGAQAIGAVISGARPLADLLWAREVEQSPLDTPERKAAFERRVMEIVARIPDETLRRHFMADIRGRLRQLLPAPPLQSKRPGRPFFQKAQEPRGPQARMALASQNRSAGLSQSAVFARRESPREALILLS